MKDLLCSVAALILTSCTAPAVANEVRYEADNPQALAELVTDAINNLDDNKEYGALLYCNEDICWSSDLMYGNSNSISAAEGSRVYVEEDTDYLVGNIHSHPKSDYDSLVVNTLFDTLNHRPSVQDYQWSLSLATDGLVFQDFTIYIIGPDNILRGYDLPKP
jgi:hypothetical protein